MINLNYYGDWNNDDQKTQTEIKLQATLATLIQVLRDQVESEVETCIFFLETCIIVSHVKAIKIKRIDDSCLTFSLEHMICVTHLCCVKLKGVPSVPKCKTWKECFYKRFLQPTILLHMIDFLGSLSSNIHWLLLCLHTLM